MKEKNHIAENVIKLLFSIVPLTLGGVFMYGIWFNYAVRQRAFDPIEDIIALAIGLFLLFFGVYLIHEKFAHFLFFLFLGVIGFLGATAALFFWNEVRDPSLFSVDRTPLMREYFLYISLSFLGFGLLLFHWGLGKFFIVTWMSAFFFYFLLSVIFSGQYAYIIIALFGLLIAKMANKSLIAVLLSLPALAVLIIVVANAVQIHNGLYDFSFFIYLTIWGVIISPLLYWTVLEGLRVDEKILRDYVETLPFRRDKHG